MLHKPLQVAAAVVATLALGVGAAFGSGTPVDLTTLNASATVNGAIFTQSNFSSSTGTGVFDSFVRFQAGSTEQGYNTSGRPVQYDELTSPFTRDLSLNQVPLVNVGGTLYREFRLDINEVSGNPSAFLSLDKLRLFLSPTASINSADPTSATFGQSDGTFLVYDLDAGTDRYVKLNYDLAPGSGNGDMVFLVPNSAFGEAGLTCQYNGFDGASCGKYVYLYSEAGEEYSSSDGFEEWSVRKAAYLTVTKTATTTYTRTFPWTIDKSATPASWSLFANESGTSHYTVDLTKGIGVDSNWALSGNIVVSNPSGAAASVTGVTDSISGVGSVVPACPVEFPYLLAAGGSFTCTYSSALPDGTSRTNTATATLADGGSFQGTAPVTFGSPTTLVNDTIHVTDSVQGSLGAFSASGSTSYDKTFTCNGDAGMHDNTATITETGQHDSASVTVNCYEISVTKDANTSLTRTYDWTIDKSVTPASWQLFTGESGTSRYTVSVDKTGYTDSAWAVSGNIHVNNPAPMAATINSVSDAISGGINATVDCGVGVNFPYSLAAGATLDCTYGASLPDGTSRTNTATAVRQNHNYTYLLVASNAGTTSRTGIASVSFASPTITSVNASINVTDTNGSSWGPVSDDATWTYDRTFTCNGDAGTHDNTATITQTSQHDSASVSVSCYEINVTKDAATTYQRQFSWTIDKFSSDPNGGALTLNPGETYVGYPYSIKVDVDHYTDSAWAASGNIHVNNPNPIPATINGVSDVLTGAIDATVDCGVTFPYTLAANSTLDCTYGADLPDATSRTNTATAVRQNHNYTYLLVASDGTTVDKTGTANVTFGAPTKLVDESTTIVDDYGTPGDTSDDLTFGPVSYTQAPKTFSYTRTFGPFDTNQCGQVTIDNTVTFTTNDTNTKGSDHWPLVITIPCPTGCTLTQGYWKTHSEFGPAPTDENWYNIGDVDGDGVSEGPNETFFLSGQTWYQVFWTAPKGGNAYYILAHQYEAAVLNIASPADAPQSVLDAITWAEGFFSTHTQNDKLSKTLRSEVIAYAGLLGSYNEGTIGPGHCSEDSIARSASS